MDKKILKTFALKIIFNLDPWMLPFLGGKSSYLGLSLCRDVSVLYLPPGNRLIFLLHVVYQSMKLFVLSLSFSAMDR